MQAREFLASASGSGPVGRFIHSRPLPSPQPASPIAEHNVGALVVTSDGGSVAGIVSERDVVRLLDRAPGGLDHQVSSIMTSEVATCEPTATVDDLMALMTNRRIRHVPVLAEGQLAGIVSIGDVVKMTIFVTRMQHNTKVWDARREYFTGDFPACTLVEVSSLAKPEILLEIEATAVIGSSAR